MANEAWHLDKRVNVAMIGSFLVQTAAIAWWAAGVSQRIIELEKRADISAPQAERIIRLEEKVGVIHDDVNEVKRLVQAQAPRKN
jgi:hypothetical protein